MGEMDVLHAFDVTEVRSQSRKKTEQSKEDLSFSQVLNKKQQRCPYSSRAENGEIHYKGTTFTCDEKTNSICLGDMSNPKDILMINLPSGGHVKVNVHNLDELLNAAGMFSAMDLCAIMKAISHYNHYAGKFRELQEEEEAVENVTEKKNLQELGRKPEPVEEKDWREMSEEEWDKMMADVERYIDEYKDRLSERQKKQEEAAQKAALMADPTRRSGAASAAALAAATGFGFGSYTEAAYDREQTEEEKGRQK